MDVIVPTVSNDGKKLTFSPQLQLLPCWVPRSEPGALVSLASQGTPMCEGLSLTETEAEE